MWQRPRRTFSTPALRSSASTRTSAPCSSNAPTWRLTPPPSRGMWSGRCSTSTASSPGSTPASRRAISASPAARSDGRRVTWSLGARSRREAEASSDPEIDALHFGILRELGGTPRHDRAADLQHVGAIRDLERELDRLLGKEHGEALLVQPPERLVDSVDGRRGKPEARLVEHQQRRI